MLHLCPLHPLDTTIGGAEVQIFGKGRRGVVTMWAIIENVVERKDD